MTLCLHRGAAAVEPAALAELITPAATHSHVPLPHVDLVSMVKYALGYFGHQVVEEHHAITEDGMRYFGVLSLRSGYGFYEDTVGLRNSHDKSFPIGIAFGSRTFVCDNLAFAGDHVIKRKHTANSKRDLPGLVAEVVEPLADQRRAQALTFDRYRFTPLLEHQVDHAILTMYRQGVLNVQRIPEVLHQWHEPAHDWGGETAWRLFNAATFALTGKVAEAPHITSRLHQVIDGVCETVH
ncbi:MAG: hypothetical protein RLO51_11070 [Thalassobaculum sp.]|uniref:DUF932 domain-containing protein n=1 Tax=Thalassobaculum sp. TaxID=2022740 RepID=UPI0032EC8421